MTGEDTQADAHDRPSEVRNNELKRENEHLQNALAEQKRNAEEYLNRLKYLQADFDNYRKKFDREKEMIIALAEERLITDLLTTVDDLERMLQLSTDSVGKQGILLLYRNFMKVLEDHGLKRIESVGKKFDPHYHEAYCMEICDCASDTILEEFQAGYMLKTKIIRPAKVKVAVTSEETGGNNNGEREDHRN
jgi:Molecular chaperone GrpE (heat shock protein)